MIERADGFISLLRAKAETNPDGVFGDFEGQPLTFAHIDHMSDAFAANLRRRGVARGDRVAAMLRNSPSSIAVVFGLAKAGAIWIPVNVRQQGEGLRYILEHSDPKLIVAEADLMETLHDSGATLPRTIVRSGGYAGTLDWILSQPHTFLLCRSR